MRRFLYAAGPGDIVGTYRFWCRGEDDPEIPNVAYSRQFLDLCKELGAEAWLISAHPRRESVKDGSFRVEHRPIPFSDRAGLAFHLGRVLYTAGLVRSAIQYRADVVIVGHGVHWFLLRPLSWAGIRTIPAIHNTLWTSSDRLKLVNRVLLRLARPLFMRESLAILSHRGACTRQVVELANGMPRPIVHFVPWYRESAFAGIPEHGAPRPPFRVLFVGRIEQYKGVFDLLEIAVDLRKLGRSDIEFDLCGTGSALERLRKGVIQAGVETSFRCHGWCRPTDQLKAMLGRCHAVIVPTRSDFREGFNLVVAEGTLSRRPVITSRLCPAMELVRDAVVEVEPEDLAGYRDAIIKLCDDDAFYEAKRQACESLRSQFFEPSRSWGAGLARALNGVHRQ